MSEYPDKEQLESGLDFILQSLDDLGSLEMIVIRPAENERKILESGGLSIGNSIIEITSLPHNGCKKFASRFGIEAVKFANSATGKKYHLRGVNAKIIRPGSIKVGDTVKKL